jgi:catechol 2,3-dioxygenase-like lactoylglutathione lyase family enzyme
MKLENIKYMIMAQDMKRAIEFYTKVIGMRVKFDSPEWTELQWENSTVALHGGGSGKPNRTGLSFQVSDIFKACDELKAAGATILSGPEDREGEPIILLEVRDQEGNEIMFSQYKG